VVNWKNANYQGFSLSILDTVRQKLTFINCFFLLMYDIGVIAIYFFPSCSLSPGKGGPFSLINTAILTK
jgi:hypothetical protein